MAGMTKELNFKFLFNLKRPRVARSALLGSITSEYQYVLWCGGAKTGLFLRVPPIKPLLRLLPLIYLVLKPEIPTHEAVQKQRG